MDAECSQERKRCCESLFCGGVAAHSPAGRLLHPASKERWNAGFAMTSLKKGNGQAFL
jgi:hypothetical protein